MPLFFNNASATRCDVFVDLWGDRGAHHDGQAWASWWVFDGGDDMAHVQRMDAVGKLNDQVKKLEAEGGIEIGGTPKKLLCFKSGDGKVMMSGSCGKCWNCNLKYDQFQAHLFAIADFPVLPRIGSLMSCIPPARWGLRHALHLDALDWGIRLWFGEKGLGREGIKFGMQRMRRKHRAPKHM